MGGFNQLQRHLSKVRPMEARVRSSLPSVLQSKVPTTGKAFRKLYWKHHSK